MSLDIYLRQFAVRWMVSMAAVEVKIWNLSQKNEEDILESLKDKLFKSINPNHKNSSQNSSKLSKLPIIVIS